MNDSVAIRVDGVRKKYRLYDERNQSLKAAVMRGRRARYREFDALKGVTFDIPQGSTFGIIGENGSGKSTLLKCMAGILKPEQGSIETRGKISALLELGAGFHPELSGRENVFLNGAILGMSKAQLTARFDEIVDFAGLEEFIDSPVRNYSSGMYIRLGFSVAINVDPDILMVDEVLTVGDEQFQRKCAEKFADFKDSGKTVVVVSHALGYMRDFCDDIALLEHGNLVKVGKSGDVVDRYLTEIHEDRRPDGEHGVRWGSGEALVTNFELLDSSGNAVTTVRAGDAVTFRFHYETHRPIERPVFSMLITTIDGVELTRPNTKEYDMVPDYLEGKGFLDLQVDRLLLVRGAYDVSIGLRDYAMTYEYDCRHRSFRFDVESGSPPDNEGHVSLGGAWTFRSAEALR